MPYYQNLIPRSYALQALQQGGGIYNQIPVRALPLPGKNDVQLPMNAGKICQDAAEGIMPYASQLGAFFEEFAVFCARLEAQLRMLRSIWSEFRPRLCLAERLPLGEYAVPLLACRQLNIPSIGLPHAELYLAAVGQSDLPATRHVFANAFTEDAFIETEPAAAGKTGSFTVVDMENEYISQRNGRLIPRDNKVNILVVTGTPIGHAPLIVSCTEKDQTDGLSGLNDTPPNLRQLIRVAFKTHPSTPGFWDYRLAGIEQERILPKDSTMADALLTTDVLVSLNYIGSPSCQAMGKGIPVITWYLERSAILRNPRLFIVANTGLIAETREEVWEYIRRLISEEKFRDELIVRQKEFYETQLRPRRDDWGAWLKETIEEGA